MKKCIILLLSVFLLTSCEANIKNIPPDISKAFSSALSFSVGEILYKGIFNLESNDSMKIEFNAPAGVENTVFSYNNGEIDVAVEGKTIGDKNSISRGYVFEFFKALKEIISENTEYEFLNNQFMFIKGDNRLYVNQDGSFDRLVLGTQTYYFR